MKTQSSWIIKLMYAGSLFALVMVIPYIFSLVYTLLANYQDGYHYLYSILMFTNVIPITFFLLMAGILFGMVNFIKSIESLTQTNELLEDAIVRLADNEITTPETHPLETHYQQSRR
jgi:Sec-independent protein secretion pathway component TatC